MASNTAIGQRAVPAGERADQPRRGSPFGRAVRGVVRTAAFVGKELTEVRRQPRLILSLVLGPFLILFLFGIGYSAAPRTVRTVLVLPADAELPADPNLYKEAFGAPFVFDSVTTDAPAARQRLLHREIGAIVYFPAQAEETVAQGRQAILQLEYNEIDPLTAQWLSYYAYVQTSELNKRILIEGLKQNGLGASGGQQQAAETKALADQMAQDAATLRNAVAAKDRNAALDRIAAIRAGNARAQENIATSAQLLGGVALFGGVADPQETPQGKSLVAAQGAIQGINSTADQLESAVQANRFGDAEAGQADQIGRDAGTLAAASDQLKLIPPEILVSPFQPKSANVSPIEPDFVEYYAPAVIALLVQHIAVTLTALTLVRERLLGTVELFRVSPTSATEITFGKYVSYFLLTAVLGLGLAALLHFGLGVHILAGYAPFVITLLLLAVASLSFGFFISAVSRSESQAVQFSMLILLASVFFGGFFLSLNSLIPYVRAISYALPVTYGIQALRSVMLRGEQPPLYALAALGAFAVGLYVVSTLLFRRQFRRG